VSYFSNLRRVFVPWIFFLGAGTGVFAQSTSPGWIAAPFAGLLADQELTEVRAIQGVPGSSTVGGPIALPASVLRVHLAPAQAWALVEQAPSRTLGLMPFNGTQPGGVIAIGNAMSAPDIVSFSPGGRSAVAVSYRLATMQVFTGLDSAPQMTMQTAISGLGDIGSVAVSDDGTLTAALMSDGRVLLLSATRTPQQIFQAGSPAGIGFLPNQAAVAIADGGAATVSVIDGLNAVPFTRLTMPGPSLSADAVLVQSSLDGQSLFLAAHGGVSAYRIDLENRITQSMHVPAKFSELERLPGGDVFLFSANPGEAAWLLQFNGTNLSAGFAQSIGGRDLNDLRRVRP
jgi:hypothetical protein